MVREELESFIDGLHYGEERIFLWHGKKFFIEGFFDNGRLTLFLDQWEPPSQGYLWTCGLNDASYPVEEFLKARPFEGKTFLEIFPEATWTD